MRDASCSWRIAKSRSVVALQKALLVPGFQALPTGAALPLCCDCADAVPILVRSQVTLGQERFLSAEIFFHRVILKMVSVVDFLSAKRVCVLACCL